MSLRTNFVDDSTVFRAWGNRLISKADLRNAAIAVIPAALAAIAIITFSVIRLIAANHDADVAETSLAIERAQASYPLESRDMAIARSARAENIAQQLGVLPSTQSVIYPIVQVANALPSSVRIKALTSTENEVTISSGEALSYTSIVEARSQLSTLFPTSISTTTFPSSDTTAPTPTVTPFGQQASPDALLAATAWGWSAVIQTAPASQDPPPQRRGKP